MEKQSKDSLESNLKKGEIVKKITVRIGKVTVRIFKITVRILEIGKVTVRLKNIDITTFIRVVFIILTDLPYFLKKVVKIYIYIYIAYKR